MFDILPLYHDVDGLVGHAVVTDLKLTEDSKTINIMQQIKFTVVRVYRGDEARSLALCEGWIEGYKQGDADGFQRVPNFLPEEFRGGSGVGIRE